MRLPSKDNTSVEYPQLYLQDDVEIIQAGLLEVASEYFNRMKCVRGHADDSITLQHIRECSRISDKALLLAQDEDALALMMRRFLKEKEAKDFQQQSHRFLSVWRLNHL